MIIDVSDVVVVIVYFAIIILQYVTIYLSLSIYVKDKIILTLYVLSAPFFFILVGFLFKIGNQLNFYATAQPIILILIIFILFLRKKLHITTQKKTFEINAPYVISILTTIFFLGHDSISNISYGFIDTTNTHKEIQEVFNYRFTNYQPGIGIYFSPLYKIIDPIGSLDYLGLSVGLVVFISILLIMNMIQKGLAFVFTPLFFLPYFLENQKTLIAFQSNQFFYLYQILLLYLIYLLISRKDLQSKIVPLLLIVTLSLPLVTPPFALHSIQYFGAITLVALLIRIVSFKEIMLLLVPIIGGFVLLALNGKSTFPKMLESYDFFANSEYVNDGLIVWNFPGAIFINDVLSVKEVIDPFAGYFSFFGWAMLLLSVIILVGAIYIRQYFLLVTSTMATLFGFSTLTGVGQYSFITGRVAYYYIFAVLILIAFILNKLIFYRFHKLFLSLIPVILLVLDIIKPPVWYRYHPENVNLETLRVLSDVKGKIHFYTQLPEVVYFQQRFSNIKFMSKEDIYRHSVICKNKPCPPMVGVIDKNYSIPDLELSRKYGKSQIANQEFVEGLKLTRIQEINKNLEIENFLLEMGFKTTYVDTNYSILIKE